MKKINILLTLLTLSTLFFSGCKPIQKSITLATTTSTRDSGLLDYILPDFEKRYGYRVDVIAVGTGQALKLGKDGNVDVLLVHSKDDEERFVKEGHGIKRYDVMYNDFVIVGPKEDVAGVKVKTSAKEALKAIYQKGAMFISRGDDSGTHKIEKKLWNESNINPYGDWYISVGRGMSETLLVAYEKKAYTISDRATYLAMKDKIDLDILVENSSDLKNQYGVIAVNPNKNKKINAKGAEDFIKWILSNETQNLIAQYGKEKYGQSLFVPNAQK